MPSPTPTPAYWLMKSEPNEFSIADLERLGKTPWTGVRNYQARNYMRDRMKIGDRVLFYHSSVVPPGVAGIARICSPAYADVSALDPKSPYYDPKATRENPIWMVVDVAFVARFRRLVSLDDIRAEPSLSTMLVLKRGVRLSIQPVEADHFHWIESRGRA